MGHEGRSPADLPPFHSRVAGREVDGRSGCQPAVSPASGAAFAQASLLDTEQLGEAFPAWRRTP